MRHALWNRVILISAAVAVGAIVSVATLAWLRRPPVTAAGERRLPVSLLHHDSSGAIIDLNLEMKLLEERLLESERQTRRLEEEIAGLRRERGEREKQIAELNKRLEEMDRRIAQLRRSPAESSSPAALTPAAPNAAGESPGAAPEGETTDRTTSP